MALDMRRAGRSSHRLDESLLIADQIADGLAAAHDRGVMAPEQAQGRPIDRRADVWAFGVILYEMLAGRRPFGGSSASDALAAALTTDPDWGPIPPRVRPLLRRRLERDPRRRLRDVADFRFVIDAASHADGTVRAPSRRRRLLMAAATVAVSLALGAAGAAWFWPRSSGLEGPVRLAIVLPPGVHVSRGAGLASSVALSPDGRTLVIAGTGRDGPRLYRRPLDRLEATPLAGTEGGSSPFFSFDGAWVGFAADGRLKRVPAEGGAAADIVPLSSFPAGASWGPDDRIVFSSAPAVPCTWWKPGAGNRKYSRRRSRRTVRTFCRTAERCCSNRGDGSMCSIAERAVRRGSWKGRRLAMWPAISS